MEKNNTNQQSGGFMNGFLLGLVVGGAVIFLLVTKKGRKLLKVLTEEGFDGISQLEKLLENQSGEPENVSAKKPLGATQGKSNKNGKNHMTVAEVVDTLENAVEKGEEKAVEVITEIQKPVRRFFRGTSKRN